MLGWEPVHFPGLTLFIITWHDDVLKGWVHQVTQLMLNPHALGIFLVLVFCWLLRTSSTLVSKSRYIGWWRYAHDPTLHELPRDQGTYRWSSPQALERWFGVSSHHHDGAWSSCNRRAWRTCDGKWARTKYDLTLDHPKPWMIPFWLLGHRHVSENIIIHTANPWEVHIS